MIYAVTIRQPDDLEEFRRAARSLLAGNVAPFDVAWNDEPASSLFTNPPPAGERQIFVPRAFVDLASAVICHRDDQRWPLLYAILWRIDQGERELLAQISDPLVHRLNAMAASVRRDQHRMTAFVRFRTVQDADGEHFVAWYEPKHRTLRRTASFFIDRFASMRFSILTPDLTLHWDRNNQRFTPGLRRQDAASEDAIEEWWRRYYVSVFNPARLNTRLMNSHMPKRYWRDLPECKTIAALIEEAGARTDQMIQPPNR